MIKYEKIVDERGITIDKNGKVFNKDGIELNGRIKKQGYKTIAVRIDGKKRDVKVHRLQAYKKYGDALFEDGVVVRHLNNNKLDNSWDNIAIGTSYDNSMDNPPEVRMRCAISASITSRKYTKEFIDEIKKKHSEGLSYREISEIYGIPKSSISFMLNNEYKTDL
jgi:DNA-binding CsgD family transcriptional regulator